MNSCNQGDLTMAAEYFTESFDAFINDMMTEWKMPGVAIGIVNGEDIFTKGYGAVKPDGAKVTGETIFDCASMSKSFTAAACALLVDDEKLPHIQWDTTVSSLIRDDFVLHDPVSTNTVTIRDVLTHRTGVPGNDFSTVSRNATNPDTPKSVTRKLRHFPPNEPLRSKWQYNNEMFVAASYMVESVAGQPFPEILKERFWKPLAMDNTGYGLKTFEGVNPEHIAIPFDWDESTGEYVELLWVNGEDGQGAGEIKSTATDYAKWVRAMMQGTTGITDDNTAELVKPQMFAYKQDATPSQSPVFVGMGWEIEYYDGRKMVSHGGAIPGFTSYMKYVPASKFGFVMFANSSGMGSAQVPIAARLLDDHFKVPDAVRFDWSKHTRDDEAKYLREKADDADKLYPDKPNPPLPLPVPWEALTGDYDHPAYGKITLTLKGDGLFADFTDRTYPCELTFEHVSGDYFIMWERLVPNRHQKFCYKAQIKIRPTGDVMELGADFSQIDGADLVWFRKASIEKNSSE